MTQPNSPRYLAQDANYLGTLKSKLGDLQGIETLVYELIQNADDVQTADGQAGASRILFDVTDAALVVENDGEFRPKDFQRMTEILHGGKSAEADTTGAFGIGFVAVYQVTDTPQIIASGQQWTIRPSAPRDQRIEIFDNVTTENTRFVLPWASDPNSPTRQALGATAVTSAEIATFPDRIAVAIRRAALFLTQLSTLEVRHNGTPVLTLSRSVANGQVTLDEGDTIASWHIFQSDFSEQAAELRKRFASVNPQRGTQVTVAMPANGGEASGSLYATLPSATACPFALNINASFFPTTDRKQIRFDDDYRGAWNTAALAAAAVALGGAIRTLPQQLGAARWSNLLAQLWASRDDAVWGVFWETLAPILAERPVVQLVAGEWVMPRNAVLAMSEAEISAETILAHAGIPMARPTTQPAHAALRTLGAEPLTLQHIADCNSFTSGQPAFQKAGSSLATLEQWKVLWAAVDEIVRDPLRERDRHLLPTLALAWNSDGLLKPLRRLWRGDAASAAAFPNVSWLDTSLHDVPFLRRNIARFDIDAALDHLELLGNETLESRWSDRLLDPNALLDWFAQRSHEVSRLSRADRLRRVALVPMGGDLRPLDGLFMPADFHDPLALVVASDAASQGNIIPQSLFANPSVRPLLHRLEVPELTFESWLTQRLPTALAQVNRLPSNAVWNVIHMLARRLGELRTLWVEDGVRKLPLVACLDGQFRSADVVYFDTPLVRQTLTTRTQLAETPDESVAALYRWLGVRDTPDWTDALTALQTISDTVGYPGALDDGELAAVQACWGLIGQAFDEEGEGAGAAGAISAELQNLEDDLIIPNASKTLCAPNTLFFADQAYLQQRFAEQLHEHLIPRLPASWRAMQAAGVRRLSAVVQPQLDPHTTAVDAFAVAERIRERRPLLERIAAAETRSISLDLLDTLQFKETASLMVSYQLDSANFSAETTPHAAQALYVADTMTLFVTPQPVWAAIARELARALSPEVVRGGLASGIYLVLSSADVDVAGKALDTLGL